MQFRKLAAASAVTFILVAPWATAQTVTTGQATPSTTAAATQATSGDTSATAAGTDQSKMDTVTVLARPKTEVQLTTDSQPVTASFALSAVSGINPSLLAGVTANGYARKVAVDNQSVGQVLITTVAKGNKEEAISDQGLTAQFDATNTGDLFPDKTVQVTGSKSALLTALQKLNAANATPEPQKTQANDATVATPSDGSSNDLASSYQTPSTTTATKAEPTTSTTVTTDGCSVRIDTTAGYAYQQNKVETLTNGTVTSEGSCSDSGTSYPLKKSYTSCSDDVDLTAMKAWSEYKLYYVDDGGENHTVSDCQKDDQDYYTITEDESQCSIFLDFDKHEAVPQSAMVYTDRNGKVVQARGCQTSTLTAAIPMTETTSGCTIRNDFTAAKSYEQSMWTYVRDGVTYIASACADDGTVYDQQTVYKDASGQYICKPITDLGAGTAILQSRKAITVDGQVQYITECTPDTASKAIVATTDGCTDMSAWTHDVSAGVSYGQERFYFEDGGTRSYVTGCQNSGVTYPEDQTITGYQYHDDQLWAYPLTKVSVTANGSTYTIVNSAVLDGAPQVPYVLDGTTSQTTGESTYEGCDGYSLTEKYEQWKRPDDTVYLKDIGPGDPVGPRNVCDVAQIGSKNVVVGLQKISGPDCEHVLDASEGKIDYFPNVGLNATGKVDGKYTKTNRETGDIVSTYYAWTGSGFSQGIHPLQCNGDNGANETFNYPYFSYRCPGSGCSATLVSTAPTGW